MTGWIDGLPSETYGEPGKGTELALTLVYLSFTVFPMEMGDMGKDSLMGNGRV